jgi:phospho-N-acetylmuramoyl-pentapeptide-transferase
VKEILIAGALALFISLFGTPVLIKMLVRRGFGQFIRDDGPSSHHTKRGTPTMGGIIIIFSVLVSYLVAHLLSGNTVSVSAILVLGLVLAIGFVGFLDDYMKISRQNSGGISGKQKILGQVIAASTFGYLGLKFADRDGYTPISLQLSTVRDTSITLGVVAVVIWVAFMVTATSNGVNLTDGLDGLATGAAVMTFISFVLIGVWEFGQSCAVVAASSNCYHVRDPLDLAVLSAAFAGSCTGFLWWNASPAKIFMGDTGSLALGAALAGIATSLRIELLLIPLGGLFVIITLSVALQVLYFKATGGKRLFKMAPLHHHFELMGWGQVTVVLRFWIIAGLCVAMGLGLFYADWVVG